MVFVSATPGEYERTHSPRIVEQIVRPTGIVDPDVEVRETRNQIDDLMNEIRGRVDRNERTLVTTLTKKMSEDLTDYLLEMGFKVRYLHSEIDTLERIQIIRDLRLGEYDVLVGVNLLREGLDLPEVSLVAILDADKEGFLRGATSLIQTIGRAARNVDGKVLMYADKQTAAMQAAISRRPTAAARSSSPTTSEHGITPETIVKGISDIAEFLMSDSKVPKSRRRRQRAASDDGAGRDREDDRRARGGDARRGRGAALRVRRQAARRDPRPQAPARQGRRGGQMTVPEPGPGRPSLAESASQRVQAILEAAEASAAEIRGEAQDEAEAIRAQARADAGRASESIEAAVRRLEGLHGELGALIASLRSEPPAPPLASPPAGAPPVVPRAIAPASSVPPPAAAPATSEDEAAGARLIALNMALEGTPREQTAQFLAENFSLADAQQLLDEVYASAER